MQIETLQLSVQNKILKRSGLLKPRADLPNFDRLSNDTRMKVISKEIIVIIIKTVLGFSI